MAITSPHNFEALLYREIAHRNTDRQTRHLFAINDESRVAGAILFLQNILDHVSDHDYMHGNQSFLKSCDDAIRRLSTISDKGKSKIVGLLGLVCLNAKLLDRRFNSPDVAEQQATDEYCRKLFDDTPIREAIQAVYRSAKSPPGSIESKSWEEIDFTELRYHKAGTTSFILVTSSSKPIDQSGAHSELVLKCVLFPWNKLTAVAKATDDYATTYGAARTTRVIVHPIASTERWILMPFQEGLTLGEYLAELESKSPSAAERISKARQLASKLTRALHELAGESPVEGGRIERQHLDLSPSNIILVPKSNEIKFIDLGVNHLYSRQVGIAEHDDSVYISPEIKNRGGSVTADAYSLGIILTQVVCGYAPRDNRVPDEIWEISPAIGRVLEDLIEEDQRKRLLLYQSSAPFSFDSLGRYLDFTFELAMSEPETSKSGWRRLQARLVPTSREFRTQWKRWQLSRQAGRVARYDTYLLLFVVIAAFFWWFIVAWAEFFKIDKAALFHNLVSLKITYLPKQDRLIANLAGVSQGLVAAKFYQTIFARLTTRSIPGKLALLTELCIRSTTLLALPVIVLVVYWKPSLWAWGCVAPAFAVTITNWLTLTLASRILQAGAGKLSSIPMAAQVSSRGYEQWWWTMLLYAGLLVILALGLQSGWLKDTWPYVIVLTVVTIGVHYISKCAVAGPGIRGELARVFSAGERLAILYERGNISDSSWPPRLRKSANTKLAHKRGVTAPSRALR